MFLVPLFANGDQEGGIKNYKLALSGPPGCAEVVAAEKFAEYVSELSEDRIKIDVLSGGQGGGEREIGEALNLGTMDFGVLAGVLMNFDQALTIVEWDLLFKSDDHVRAVMNGSVGEKISQRLIDNIGVRQIGVFMRTPRLLTTNKPVNCLADLQGMKIRVPEMPARVKLWEALGAKPTPMSFTEVVSSLQLGTIDGQENPISVIESAKIYEAIDYLADTRHLHGFMLLLVNEDVWNSLSPAEQEIINEAAGRACKFNDGLVAAGEDTLMKKVSAEMTVTHPDMQEWRDAVKDVYKEFADVNGFLDLYESIIEVGEDF